VVAVQKAGAYNTIGLAPNGISWIGKVLIVSTGNRVYTGTGLIAYLNFAAWLWTPISNPMVQYAQHVHLPAMSFPYRMYSNVRST